MSLAEALPSLPDGVTLRGPWGERYGDVLSPAALAFVAGLARRFGPERDALLKRRDEVRGAPLDFLPETAHVREAAWTVAPLPADLLDRRVEITGPVDRKMIINALNSGASCFMADFEDSSTPTFANMVEGQLHLADAVRRRIDFTHPVTGKRYALKEQTATLLVRPRGLHLDEAHVLVDDKPISGSLFDFGLYFFHNVLELERRGSGPYFYLPKLESHLEARWWNEVFLHAQKVLGVPKGTIKATVLIETLPAAFQMDEILYELRDHSAGLNCGRWDYIFSFIKSHRDDPEAVLPNRGQIGMTQPFMAAYTRRVVQTCHRRRVHAMGGMAAQIPIKADPEANATALEKVRQDKLREVRGGHDGTWVAHPGLVPVAKAIFDEHMPEPNQIDAQLEGTVTREDLLAIPKGTRTEDGLRHNIRVGVQYLAAWLQGTGCVPIDHLMEDAATAEISRTQIWQWVKHGATLEDGRVVTTDLVRTVLNEELQGLGAGHEDAAELFLRVATEEPFVEFLTLPAYAAVTTFTA